MIATTTTVTKAMLRVLRDMQAGAVLTRRDYTSGYALASSRGRTSMAYVMPMKMDDMGLIVFTRDNELARFSTSTAALTDKAKAILEKV